MVRHDAVRIKCYTASIDGGGEHALEGVVVGSAVEKQRAFRGSIDDVIDGAGEMRAFSAWHEGSFQRNEDAHVPVAH
jgi:hypothetical protein